MVGCEPQSGTGFAEFAERNRDQLTGQQFQSRYCAPVYRQFSDYTHLKFYEISLRDACVLEGASFDTFGHADWRPTDATAGPYEL